MYRLIFGAGALALALTGTLGVSAKDHPLTTLYDFPTDADGYFPAVAAVDRHGAVYGFTTNGGGLGYCGWGGCGTIFKLKPSGQKIVLHTFTGDEGGRVMSIVLDDDGTIYGSAFMGGAQNAGTIFKLATDGTVTLLHTFATSIGSPAPGGSHPVGPIMRGRDGNFYGTTVDGGIDTDCGGEHGCGTVFRLTPDGHFTTLYAFKGGSDSCSPYSGVVDDAAGNLYGTTAGCGVPHKYGTLFKLAPDGTETILHTFTSGTDGAFPTATPVFDAAGNLYGAADQGGSNPCEGGGPGPGCGLIYKVTADGTYSILHTFKSLYYGRGPSAPLYLDDKGNLYGTTTSGGAVALCNPPYGCGTVFKIAPDGKETVLHRFIGWDHDQGAIPMTAVIRGSGRDSDYLYSTTSLGGASKECAQGCGVIFKIKK